MKEESLWNCSKVATRAFVDASLSATVWGSQTFLPMLNNLVRQTKKGGQSHYKPFFPHYGLLTVASACLQAHLPLVQYMQPPIPQLPETPGGERPSAAPSCWRLLGWKGRGFGDDQVLLCIRNLSLLNNLNPNLYIIILHATQCSCTGRWWFKLRLDGRGVNEKWSTYSRTFQERSKCWKYFPVKLYKAFMQNHVHVTQLSSKAVKLAFRFQMS